MSEYLSKEEVKLWRSSLEKITLEEYAARLGKKIEEAKTTNDLVDIVLKGQPVISSSEIWTQTKGERLSTIADRAYEREREISSTPFSIGNLNIDSVKPAVATAEAHSSAKIAKPVKALPKKETKPVKTAINNKVKKEIKSNDTKVDTLREEVRFVFKKALTDREQRVFDYFAQNQEKIVYAKDLATLLELPRDYVYKYIKNLRSKIEGDKLQNADKGGFVLSI